MAASNPHLRAVRQAYDQVIAQATTAPDAQLTTQQAVALLRSSGKVRGLPRTGSTARPGSGRTVYRDAVRGVAQNPANGHQAPPGSLGQGL